MGVWWTGRRRRLLAALDVGAAHQHLHRAMPDRDAQPQGEFGVDPAAAVDAAGSGVDLLNLVGQPHMTQRPQRRRVGSQAVALLFGEASEVLFRKDCVSGQQLDRQAPVLVRSSAGCSLRRAVRLNPPHARSARSRTTSRWWGAKRSTNSISPTQDELGKEELHQP